MFYAKSTGGFYDADIHGAAIPADSVEITSAEHEALLDGQSQGKQIVGDASGLPVAVDPQPPTLAELKTAKNAAINAARGTANTGTFSHSGKTFSCDPLSRGDIDGMNGYVALFAALPAAFAGVWKAADNTYFAIADVAAWKAFYSSMVIQGAANFAHAEDLKSQLAAATTPEAVAAIVW